MSAATQSLSTNAWNRPPFALDTEIGQLGVLTEDTMHSAQVEVCSRAVDVADAAELLDMLGLLPGGLAPVAGESLARMRGARNQRRREARAARRSA